jgi:predicted ATPase
MAELPSGKVTLLFSDIEGSTKLLDELGPERYREVLAEHRRVLREAFERHGGYEVDYEGDAFFVAFADPQHAVGAAREAQAALSGGPVKTRMGVHTGQPLLDPPKYVGRDVHLAARVMSAGHGGQTLLSRATRDLVESVDLRDLGEHRLKDFAEPVWLFQLGEHQFPPLKTISNTNLPRPASSFVGRKAEVAALRSLLVGGARLVTLTGAGGSGKTRLAIEAAGELVHHFRNGVFWVGLATIRDEALVLPTVGRTIGAKDGLAEHISEKELLLLLDNLEQVVAVAPALASLVEACPNLKLLITSRELLRVRGEVEYGVLPLADPEAVELFCARAQLPTTAAVEELCQRLDNMPLALELAAARTKALTPEQILERLGDRLDLLKGGRDAEPRQATLRATIAWSHDLLMPAEQQLFRRLGVFTGGCTLDAATAVADADLDTLQSLVEKSLVRHTDQRFWMLETIREYAIERLTVSSEEEQVHRRYATFFLALAESANLCVERMDLGERHELVLPEADNLRAALRWALAHGEIELAGSITVALEQFWVTKNPGEGARWTSELLERSAQMSPLLRARLLRVHGGMHYIVGEFEEGMRWHSEALDEFRRLGDDAATGHMLLREAIESQRSGDPARARALCEEGLSLDKSRSGQAQALNTLASVAFDEGQTQEALDRLDEAARLAGEVGNGWLQSHSLLARAEYAMILGRPDVARPACREGLAIGRAIGDRQWTHWGVTLAAWIAAEKGQLAEAGRLWGALEAEAEREPIGQWEGERDTWVERIVRAAPEFEQASQEGRRLEHADAMDIALSLA